jgi:hypothetical protein
MAQIQYSPLVSNAAGSIGGTTFSRVRSGATARKRPRPPHPGAPFQLTLQQQLLKAAQIWAAGLLITQTDWVAYAATVTLTNRLGQTFHPTGMNMFVRTSIFEDRCSLTEHDLRLPTASGVAAATVPTLSVVAGNLRVTAVSNIVDPEDKVLFTIYRPHPVLALSRRHVLGDFAWDSGVGVPHDIFDDIAAAYGPGNTVWISVAVVNRDTNYRISSRQSYALSYTVP